MGYSSVILVFSGIVLFTDIEFYQSGVIVFPLGYGISLINILHFFNFPRFLLPFAFPYAMFLNPLHHPIVFFLIWQAFIFFYGYKESTEIEIRKIITGFIIGFIVFNFFWTIVLIAVLLSIIALGGACSGGSGSCYQCPSKKKKSSEKKSSSLHQTSFKDI